MADRSIAAGDTLNKFRFEFNGTAEDIGEISGSTGASGIIADATDVVESITLLNTDLTTISTRNGLRVPEQIVQLRQQTPFSLNQELRFYYTHREKFWKLISKNKLM